MLLFAPMIRFTLSALPALLLYPALGQAVPATAQVPSAADLCRHWQQIDLSSLQQEIGRRNISFIAINDKGQCWGTDKEQIRKRHAPWSTFKIPHTLIALQTGAIKADSEAVAWNQRKYPRQEWWPKDWAQEQSLRSAFQRSVPWYFAELIPGVGTKGYQTWLARFRYGNQISNQNTFWLNQGLEIAPIEQVAFLQCVARNGCGISPQHVAGFEQIAQEDEAQGHKLYAKTGAGPLKANEMDGAFSGWFTGYIRHAGGHTSFALYAEAPAFADLKSFRREFSYKLLSQIKAWPEE